MKKILKILAAALTAVVTLVVVAGIIVWLTFEPNDYKGYIADWVGSRTGRELVIEDDLELTFFPWLGVTTGSVRLGNAPGFGEEPFAEVDRLTVSVRLLPLLRRQVEIGTITLDGLALDLATDDGGVANWDDLIATASPDSSAAPSGEAGEPFLQSLNIAGVQINEGLIFWRESTRDVRFVVSELNVETGTVTPGRPVDVELAFRLVGVDPQLSADVDISGTAVIDTARSTVETRDLRIAFNLADGRGNERAAGALRIDNVRIAPAGDAIELARGDLTAALTSPPVGPDEAELRVGWSAASIDRQAATLEVGDLATEFAGIGAQWTLSGSDLFEQPVLTGNVRLAPQPLAAALSVLGVEAGDGAHTDLGDFDLQSTFTMLPLTREISLSGLTANGLGIRLTGDAAVSAEGSVSGTFATNAFDPARALSLLPQETLTRIDTASIGPVSAAGAVDLDAATGALAVEGLQVDAFGARLSASVSRLENGQRYTGTLAVPALEAVALARVLGELVPDALPPAALGELALRTDFDYASSSVALTALTARAAGLDLRGTVQLSGLGDSPAWTGRIEVLPFDPKALLERFDRPMAPRVDPTALASLRATAQIDGDAARSSFRELEVVVDDSTVTGELTMSFGEGSAFDLDLAIDRLDADRYMPAAAEPPPEGAAPAATEIALPIEILSNQRLGGAFEVGTLTITGLELGNVAAALEVGDGLGAVESARAELYGGAFEGTLRLDARGDSPRLSLDGTATTIEIAPLLADLRGEANMTGTGSFDLSLAGSGEVLNTVLESAAGSVSFSVRDGLIRGFDVGHTLCSVYNAREGLPRPAAQNAPVTRYRLMRASAAVVDGVARTEDLEATTSFMTVSGSGQSNLVSRAINYDLVATLTGSIEIDRCESMDALIGRSIPMRATGTITAPEIQPDYREILRDRIRDELQDRLRERLFN